MTGMMTAIQRPGTPTSTQVHLRMLYTQLNDLLVVLNQETHE